MFHESKSTFILQMEARIVRLGVPSVTMEAAYVAVLTPWCITSTDANAHVIDPFHFDCRHDDP